MKKLISSGLAAGLLLMGMPVSTPAESIPATRSSLTGVTQTLIDLLDQQDRTRIDSEDYASTSLRQIITFGTPAGYRIKLRYLTFGMSLVEALETARDEEMQRRLIETVQWARNPRVRAAAILTLAGFGDPSHRKHFRSAILDNRAGIRLAGIDALQRWGQPETIPLLRQAMVQDPSPFMQVYAAQALLSMGEKDGLAILWKHVDNESWVVRALAARYIGDFAAAEDYDKLVTRLSRETKNNFVVAELAISALKLISRKGDTVSYSPAQPGWRDNEEVRYTIGEGGVIHAAPLVIVPPRLRIPTSLRIASQINTQLLRLIKDELEAPLDPIQAQDPVLQDLNSFLTPAGFALQTRYSQLSYLVIEGLAGTNDLLLRSEIENLARNSTNPLIRASALIALSYSRDPRDIFLVQEAARDRNALVRMGALEAIELGRFEQALPVVTDIAAGDESPALRSYAISVLARFGQASARNMLLSQINDPDWPSRALAFLYLGRYGSDDDYTLIVSRLPYEENPFVKAEIALAALRLEPL